VQNGKSAASALVPDELELGPEEAAEEAEALVSLDPPQPVRTSTAAATVSPVRHTVRVRRMTSRLGVGWAPARPHGLACRTWMHPPTRE
jgi:hypothetical protein